MKFDVRYASHPDDSKHYDTEELRKKYLIEQLFAADDILLTYSHQDRIIAGGAMPVKKTLSLGTFKELATAYFLERREMGIINIGGDGVITLDGKKYDIGFKEGIYIGMGTKEIEFSSNDPSAPAKFYINSCPAHKTYPTVKIVKPVEGKLREYRLRAEWRPGVEYSLEIDSAAFEDIYGLVSDPIKLGLKVRPMDDYSSLTVNITGCNDTTLVVQLLNGSDAVVKQVKAEGGSAAFFYVMPGTYYLRAFADSNGNGKWDTGDFYANRQAETVSYYTKEVECKAKWDITIGWNMAERPADKQKPMDITKQKPDKEKGRSNRNANRAKELGIEYTGQ